MRAQTVHTWGANRVEQLIKQANPASLPHGPTTCLAVNPAGTLAILTVNGSPGAVAYTISGTTLAKIADPSGTGINGASCAISRDGKYAAIVGNSGNDTGWVCMYSITGTTLTSLTVPSAALNVSCCAFSPDGKELVVLSYRAGSTGSTQAVIRYGINGSTVTLLANVPNASTSLRKAWYDVAYRPDGGEVVIATGASVVRWSISAGTWSYVDALSGVNATYGTAFRVRYNALGTRIVVGLQAAAGAPSILTLSPGSTISVVPNNLSQATSERLTGLQLADLAFTSDESLVCALSQLAPVVSYANWTGAVKLVHDPDIQPTILTYAARAVWLPGDDRLLTPSSTSPYIHMYKRQKV